jgi:serine/threonine-protein kinase
VVRSDPASGGRVLRGHSVTVVLSSGPPAVAVPSVTGQSVDDAQAAIRQAGLRPQVTEQSSADVDAGQVISQTPAGGKADRGSTVQLVVSTGPAIVEVPDVRGLSIDDARQKLQDAGFRVRVRSLRIGNVIAQSPGGGSERKQGSTVTIYGI